MLPPVYGPAPVNVYVIKRDKSWALGFESYANEIERLITSD
jgi:hypothetical protein